MESSGSPCLQRVRCCNEWRNVCVEGLHNASFPAQHPALRSLHCASARATSPSPRHALRGCTPARNLAAAHDEWLRQCLCQVAKMPAILCDANSRASAVLQLALGQSSLRNAARTSCCLLASWSDCLPMIAKRHPVVAAQIVQQLDDGSTTPCSSLRPTRSDNSWRRGLPLTLTLPLTTLIFVGSNLC